MQVWGIVYLHYGYAKCLSSDKRTTPHFLFYNPSPLGSSGKILNKMDKKSYVVPEVEVLEIAVEQGFAQSGEPKFGGFGPEENWG